MTERPAFMDLPLPDASGLDDARRAEVERHVAYWQTTRDWNDDAQEGFWMYTRYQELLPARWRFLADRLMNLHDAPAQRETIAAILAVVPADTDWEPTLAQPSPAPVQL